MNTIPTIPAFPTIFLAPPAPTPGDVRMSVDEFLTAYAGEPRAELVRGVVRMQPMTSGIHGLLCGRLTAYIIFHVESNGLGLAMSNDTRVRTGPDSVRGGDVVYFSAARLPRSAVGRSMPAVVPDLIAEVKSASDTWSEVFVKVGEYLASGVRVVVVVDDESLTASIYRGAMSQEILGVGDVLTVPDVLPGFVLPLATLFA